MHILRVVFGWIFSDRSLAPATWGLVVVTALIVVDGWRKSREQTRRWKYEDDWRREEARPKAIVEIVSSTEPHQKMAFACFNLGSTTFYVDKLVVTAPDEGKEDVCDLVPKIVTPGTHVTIVYDPLRLLAWFGEETEFKEANATLVLRGATARETTAPEWFYVGYPPPRSQYANWQVGRLADRRPGAATARTPKLMEIDESI